MIRRADESHRKAIEEIYDICFPGEQAFRQWFFDRVWKAEHTLVWEEGGEILSCLQDIPVELAKGQSLYSAHYIYAAGTLPSARGRGIMGKLLSRAFEDGIRRGQLFSTLITQNKSLFDFYRPFGYTTVSLVGTVMASPVELPAGWQIRPALATDIAAIDAIYRRETANVLSFVRNHQHYAAMLDLFGEGFVVLTDESGEVKAFAFTSKTQKELTFHEACGPEKLLLGGALAKREGIPVVMQGISTGNENHFSLGCVKALTQKAQEILDKLDSAPYFNIMFN